MQQLRVNYVVMEQSVTTWLIEIIQLVLSIFNIRSRFFPRNISYDSCHVFHLTRTALEITNIGKCQLQERLLIIGEDNSMH